MSKTLPKITCDACQADLTTTGNCEDYRLVLASESKTPWYVAEGERGGFVTAMAIAPAIAQPMHFCGLNCLWEWAADAKAQAIVKRAETNRWTARLINGTVQTAPPNGWPVDAEGNCVESDS